MKKEEIANEEDYRVEEIRNFIKKYTFVPNEEIYKSIQLKYFDVSDMGLFGFNTSDYPEPFFGLFFCKSDGERISDKNDYDMNVSFSIEHAKQIYEFLKDIFEGNETDN